jgi:LmbE family N-acetylglucosaminyl deacetylase
MKCNIRETLAALLVLLAAPVFAQRELAGDARVYETLHSLANTGSVLMIAAHPDDENTALLAYFARGLCARTAYLSLTRGEGGQNLLGPEQGDALGVIRTQELLAARRIDGAEQFFTRAIDFGFSKTAEESMEKWGRERTLSDIVRVIRRFRPDVIVLRFSGTPADGHGQHQVSAILGKEGFFAAADPKQFPECGPAWQAKRLMWNMFGFTREQQDENARATGKIAVDVGGWNPVLGYSYLEIAGMSRSQHRSQGMGSPERRGSSMEALKLIAGEPVEKTLFDGVDTTWGRFPGGKPVGDALEKAIQAFQPGHPEKLVPFLAEAKRAMPVGDDPLLQRKQRDLDEAIALCAGLWVDATASEYAVLPGGKVDVTVTSVNRGPLEVRRDGKAILRNEPNLEKQGKEIPPSALYSQPYWLQLPRHGDSYEVADPNLIGTADSAPLLVEQVGFDVAGTHIELDRPVVYRWVDRLLGERWRPLAVVPPVEVRLPEPSILFPTAESKRVAVEIKAVESAKGEAHLNGATADSFALQKGEETTANFDVPAPAAQGATEDTAEVRVADRTVTVATQLIDYPHIPPQYLFPPATVKLVRVDVRNPAKNIGYVVGAGDEVPDALRQMGSTVTLLTADDLSCGDLSRFDAIVTGVRAYNTRTDLVANQQRLVDYVHDGGTLVVQYNTMNSYTGEGGGVLEHAGPWPFQIGRARVTVEEAPVAFPNPANPLLHKPNEITERDFDGWIQERGLYFATHWDSHYTPLFETHDPGEQPLLGSTLTARYGKGAFVFTAFSWFRELPAGVPGAFRIFANLLSAGKTLQ